MLALPDHTLCSARWEGWPSDHSARAPANDYICMAHYNAHSQAMCISPTADRRQSQRRCRRVAAQTGASSAADVGQCRYRWDGVGPGADSAPWCGRARCRVACIHTRARVYVGAYCLWSACVSPCARASAATVAHAARTYLEVGAVVGVEVAAGVGGREGWAVDGSRVGSAVGA
jgi:hypothetical protein